VRVVILILTLLFSGCEEGENCKTTITCEDDLEMVCDQPTTSEQENGDSITITACTYITYEHCFEKTVCTKNDD